MREFHKSSHLSGNNATYIEDLYDAYLENPSSVETEWGKYFATMNHKIGCSKDKDISHGVIRENFRKLAQHSDSDKVSQSILMNILPEREISNNKQAAVNEFIEAYRQFAHLSANTDPLRIKQFSDPRLQLEYYRLSDENLNKNFYTKGVLKKSPASLKDIRDVLIKTYCDSIGIECGTIFDQKERNWLYDYVEHRLIQPHTTETQHSILRKLIAAETLEKFLESRYVGQKRFSIEGSDSLIPLLDQLSKRAHKKGLQEIIIGMAHRGRLNVLVNILGKSPQELCEEFEGKKHYGLTSGDVKYHRGFSCDVKTATGPVHLSLAFNPSHLEFICPVVMGSVRARQNRKNGSDPDYALSVMIHGDAAFAGQGVIMETLNMSQTRAYYVGGTLHIILNNQIGFTTSTKQDARSSLYCSDIAKMLDSPVFHVNGDDPEAVIAVLQLALDYRMTFHKDVFIDLVSYRRRGHQEVDEPTVTQPIMYQIIQKHLTPLAIYANKLMNQNVCTVDNIKQWTESYRKHLEEGRPVVETIQDGLSEYYTANWKPYLGESWKKTVDTAVQLGTIKSLGKCLARIPKDFNLQRQVAVIMKARAKMTDGEQPLDWGYAEIMAYATLLNEGYSIRLTGEDSRRGTFFHRQSTLFDRKTGKTFIPLSQVGQKSNQLQIYDSLLSETGPLGFEYGYSTSDPESLIIWEAQFGDFANSAQVIIDQFISSGWQKWNRLSGLVMFLPHGFEGMGPEHSSARLERYLQLAAQNNIQVCIPTTPAQVFHLLRRQVLRPFRKPLIVMTPKSFLRFKLAVSNLEDLTRGYFQLIISDEYVRPKDVKSIVLCSGKVYYDILMKRREKNIKHVAIIRIEQLYPFPYSELEDILREYSNAKDVVWCQEEPVNQGAWFFSQHRFIASLQKNQTIRYAGRKAFAAPACGSMALHKQQQQQLVEEALQLKK